MLTRVVLDIRHSELSSSIRQQTVSVLYLVTPSLTLHCLLDLPCNVYDEAHLGCIVPK